MFDERLESLKIAESLDLHEKPHYQQQTLSVARKLRNFIR